MGTQLFDAHKQWRNRPADERFYHLTDLYETVKARREASVQSVVRMDELKWFPVGNDIAVAGAKSAAIPSDWAFEQACRLAGAPASFLAKLPAENAAADLNAVMKNATRETMKMLWANGTTDKNALIPAADGSTIMVPSGDGATLMPSSELGIVRCFTTPTYARVWDSDFIKGIGDLIGWETNGWHRPPSITDDKGKPGGLYASARDCFIFMVNEDVSFDGGVNGGILHRGFFAWNTEVWGTSWGIAGFLHQRVCGNHIVWGAHKLFDLRGIHVGKDLTRRVMLGIGERLRAYMRAPADEQRMLDTARDVTLGKDLDEVTKYLTDPKFGYTKSDAKGIWEEVERVGGDPTNLWDVVQAATRLSQNSPHTNVRTADDKRAGKLLEVVF